MSSMAGAYRRLANGAGKAPVRRRQPIPRVADLSPEPRGRRRRRERYDSSPDLSGSDDEFSGRKRKKVPARVRQPRARAARGRAIPQHHVPAAADSSDDSSDDDEEDGDHMNNDLVLPIPVAEAAIGNGVHGAQPEPGPAAAPEEIAGPSNNNLYQRNAAEKVTAGPSSSDASSIKVEPPARHVAHTRILQPTNSDDKKLAQERVFAVDAKIDVPFGDPIVSVLTNPVAMKSAPFHRMRAQIIGCRSISKDPTLTARGVNRDILVSFALDPRTLIGGQSCLLVRFCTVPSEILAADHHPPNLAIAINGEEIMKPKNVNYGMIKHKLWYPPVEIEAKVLRAGQNQLSISWTLEGNSKPSAAPVENEYFLFVEVADRKPLETVIQEILGRKTTLEFGVAKVYKQMVDDDGDIAGDYRTTSLICPVSRQRIGLPVRGRHCHHLECFDAQAFLSLNSGASARFTCPKCSSCVPLDTLVVDGFTEEMLRFTSHSSLEVIAENGMVKIREKTAAPPAVVITTESTQRDSIILLD